jgi:hypothetical protein
MFVIYGCGYLLTRAGYALAALAPEPSDTPADIAAYMFKALLWTGRTDMWDTRCPDCARDGYQHSDHCPQMALARA